MATNLLHRIVALLGHDAPDTRAAAASVLGALGDGSSRVIRGLTAALDGDDAQLQRHALEALLQLGASEASAHVVPFCAARDASVRDAASRALGAFGAAALPAVKARMKQAGPEEHRALEAVLARLGGKQALSALLQSLDDADETAALGAALATRPQIREADARTRAAYLLELQRFLEERAPRPAQRRARGRSGGDGSTSTPKHGPQRAALRILGYLEDERAVPTLLRFAQPDLPPGVRQEALIALRFATTGRKVSSQLLAALVQAAEDDDRTLAQAALMTLSGLELPATAAGRLAALVRHRDESRASAALELLAARRDEASALALVSVLAEADDHRSEHAAQALAKRDDVGDVLARALLTAREPKPARRIHDVLRPFAPKLGKDVSTALLDAAVGQLSSGARGLDALLDAAREAAPDAWAARLRELAMKQTRAGDDDRAGTVLRLLCRSDRAGDDDRYALGLCELRRSSLDVGKAARDADPALERFGALLRRGFDLGAAMLEDERLDLGALYYLGFHFAEMGEPVGLELLRAVVGRAGRAKLGRMARNKLALVEGVSRAK